MTTCDCHIFRDPGILMFLIDEHITRMLLRTPITRTMIRADLRRFMMSRISLSKEETLSMVHINEFSGRVVPLKLKLVHPLEVRSLRQIR